MSSTDTNVREQIEKRAHEIWLAGGCPQGEELAHWLQAEREVLKERNLGQGKRS